MDKTLLKIYQDGFPNDSSAYAKFFFQELSSYVAVHYENNKAVAAGHIVEKEGVLFDKRAPVAYLSALSTLTEYRGKNLIRYVIDSLFAQLYKQKIPFAFLNPFHFNYYLQYGFVNVSFATSLVAKGNQAFFARELTPHDVGIMAELERQMTQNCNNCILPSTKRAHLKILEFAAEEVRGQLVFDGDEPIGYYFLSENTVFDYAAKDIEQLFSFNALKGCMYKDYSGMQKPYVQGRVIDAMRALNAYNYSLCKDFIKTFKIRDNIISENNICVQINVRGGKGCVQQVDSSDYKEIDISELCNILLNGEDDCFPKQKNMYVDRV